MSGEPRPILTVAERAAVLRVVRTHIAKLREERDCYELQAKLGSNMASTVRDVVSAEIDVLEAAVKNLWSDRPP